MTVLTGFVSGVPLRPYRSHVRRPMICMTGSPPGEDGSSHSSKPKKPKKSIKSTASWANVFLPEFGKKGPGSRPEMDLRPMSFRTDEDKGICTACDGTGVMTCTFCNGLEVVSADGQVIDCPACGGEHTVTCSVCFGTGKQVELVSPYNFFKSLCSTLLVALSLTFCLFIASNRLIIGGRRELLPCLTNRLYTLWLLKHKHIPQFSIQNCRKFPFTIPCLQYPPS